MRFESRKIGLFAAAFAVFRKDLLIEWRTRARLNALVFFAVATLLLFSFSLGADTQSLRQNASGFLWLGVLLASVLSLGESFRVETENHALEGLRLVPTDSRAIFVGKALGNAALLFVLGWVLVPLLIGVFDVTVTLGLGRLAGVLALGCLAIGAPGTVYAAIASNARARDVLLPLLLFPLMIPALVASVKATSAVLQGDAMGDFRSWLLLLGAFNLVYWALGFVLFPKVVED
ncbi:MAG: heme exporter protein CcmB [Myxococcota bacterium]